MDKFTPGPWSARRTSYDGRSCGRFYIYGNVPDYRSPVIAQIKNSTLNPMEANAQLIAAAPELLNALRGILVITDRKHVAWEAAHAAIAKATGTPP